MEADFLSVKYGSSDYEQEVQLRDRILRAPLGLTFTDQQLAAEESEFHFALRGDSQLVACLVVTPLTETHAKIRQMAVDTNFQRQGLGTQLVGKVEQELAAQGFGEVELNARDIAVDFYKRLGYETEGDLFLEVGIPHWKMTKKLTGK